MTARLNLTGRRFGYLTVTEYAGSNGRNSLWSCKCDCGALKTLVGAKLTEGSVASCGCMKVALQREKVKTHGMKRTRTYHTWCSMRDRCLNAKNKHFKDYGGRGIMVCARWLESFENFFADMGEAPEGKSLDRFPDFNGNYEPGNCRWATSIEQNRNRRSNVMITHDGKTQCITEWAEELGINIQTLTWRISRRKLPPEIAFQRTLISILAERP